MLTEVLDGNLAPIEVMTRVESDMLAGDGVRLDQSRDGDANRISSLKGKRIRLKFHLENVALYSFRSSEEPEQSNISYKLD